MNHRDALPAHAAHRRAARLGRSTPHGITVIIPAYEAWPTLQRTVMAVLNDVRELHLPWEVIVVDNESAPPLAHRLRALARPEEPLYVIRRRHLRGKHYRPGSARNLGIQRASHDCFVFLDADCVPAPGALSAYLTRVADDPLRIYIGHRVFVDAGDLDADAVAQDRRTIAAAPEVGSVSNYGQRQDRRLPELMTLDKHPRPYDCLFSCNFAVHRACLGPLRFDPAYDGHWGYEDIDLGFRLHQARRAFDYVPEAFVFHQEDGQASTDDRAAGRARNMPIFDRRCPGFINYRVAGHRAGSSASALAAVLAAQEMEFVRGQEGSRVAPMQEMRLAAPFAGAGRSAD